MGASRESRFSRRLIDRNESWCIRRSSRAPREASLRRCSLVASTSFDGTQETTRPRCMDVDVGGAGISNTALEKVVHPAAAKTIEHGGRYRQASKMRHVRLLWMFRAEGAYVHHRLRSCDPIPELDVSFRGSAWAVPPGPASSAPRWQNIATSRSAG